MVKLENDYETVPLSEISEGRRAHLQKLHGPLQRRLLWFAGPVSVALYGVGLWMTPIWQNVVMFGAVLALFLAWFMAVRLTQRGRLEASVYTFMVSVLAFEGIEILMMDGNETTELLACFAVMAYGALYTKRFLYIAAISLAGIMIASEIVKNVHIYPIYVVPPTDRLTMQIPFVVILMLLAVYILRRGQTISETMYDEVKVKSAAQEGIIGAAAKLQPVIEKVSGQLKEIANGFVAQASEHAATTSEVSTTMEHILTSAGQSAAAAGKARSIADATRERSVRSRDRLLAVQRGFGDVTKAMAGSLAAIDELSRQAQNIEEILGYNREIGEHIKVLAVNAAIEAASAGEYGKGFRVVADELREMIVKTDANLERSSGLLESISKQAKENAEVTQKSSEALAHYYEELRATGELIDSITESFAVASKQISSIAEAVQHEVAGIDQVRIGLTQIDTTAGQLETAARVLVEGVDEIVGSHENLRTVLSEGRETAFEHEARPSQTS